MAAGLRTSGGVTHLHRTDSYQRGAPTRSVTLETRRGALVADDRVLDQAPAARGDHHGLGSLRLDGQGGLAVGLHQGVDWEALGLHRDRLGVHL